MSVSDANDARFVMYTTPWCGYCHRLKSQLDREGIAYDVVDIEQNVLRGRLVLGLLVTAPDDVARLESSLAEVAERLGMSLEMSEGSGDNKRRPGGRSHVTVLGTPLHATAVAAIAGRIAELGANIDRIERMARYPVTAIDLHVSGADTEHLRPVLAAEAAHRAGRPYGGGQGNRVGVRPAAVPAGVAVGVGDDTSPPAG